MTIIPPVAMHGDVILTVNDVSLTLGGNQIIRGLSGRVDNLFQVGGPIRGQVVALLGPSGIGKTQLFRMLSGLQSPTSGRVAIGTDQRPPDPGAVGVVAQNYPLFRHRTVLGNLVIAQGRLDRTTDQKRDAAMAMLKRFGLDDRADYYPNELSGGQRQRVAIAQQLLCGNKLILMDEPFSGLDPIALVSVIELIIEVANFDDLNTILVVTHDVSAAVAVADTIWLLGRDRDAEGKIIPGARVQHVYDLIPMGLAWVSDVRHQPNFYAFVTEVEDRFQTL